jgi:hypothetical protein
LHPNTKAAVEDLEVEQIDVKTALLNGPLKETIYLEPPVGYDFGDKVLLLKKALYGLKQAARAWNDELKRHRLTENIIISGAETSLFYLEREGPHCFLLVYVDDGHLWAPKVMCWRYCGRSSTSTSASSAQWRGSSAWR